MSKKVNNLPLDENPTKVLTQDPDGVLRYAPIDAVFDGSNYLKKTGGVNQEVIDNVTFRQIDGNADVKVQSDNGIASNTLKSGENAVSTYIDTGGTTVTQLETEGAEYIIRQRDGANGVAFNSFKSTPRSVSPSDESFGKSDITVQGNVKSDDAIVDNDLLTLRQYNGQDRFKSIADLKAADSNNKTQYAGSWEFRKTDNIEPVDFERDFVPQWDRKKLQGGNVKIESLITVPPSVPGHNNDHACLSDVGADDTFYFAGVSDKQGRIYESFDYGKTLTQIADLKTQFGYSACGIWAIKEMPNRELVVNMSVLEPSGETHSYLYYSSDNRTTWSQSLIDGTATPAQLTYYKETNGGGSITFEVYGRVVNGWGLSVYKNFVLITEYGYPGVPGTSTDPNKDAVGHDITGKVFLSGDYGASFTMIFDYINPPAGISFVNLHGMHHGHGCFIDPYYINTNGVPRLVSIFGDAESRIVYSDDAGASWYDGRNKIQGYAQAVSGMAVSGGYITTPDSGLNTLQYTHRAVNPENMASENVFEMMRPEDKLVPEFATGIVYVGGNIRQRNPNSPIVTVFTPETIGQFNLGARGGVAISNDAGKTFEEIWRDTEYGMLQSIQTAVIFETKDGAIWLSPSSTYPIDLGDGQGAVGRLIKITLDRVDTDTKANLEDVVTIQNPQTVLGAKTFNAVTNYNSDIKLGGNAVNFQNDFEFHWSAAYGVFELRRKNQVDNILTIRPDSYSVGFGGIADTTNRLQVFGNSQTSGKHIIGSTTDTGETLQVTGTTRINVDALDLGLRVGNGTVPPFSVYGDGTVNAFNFNVTTGQVANVPTNPTDVVRLQDLGIKTTATTSSTVVVNPNTATSYRLNVGVTNVTLPPLANNEGKVLFLINNTGSNINVNSNAGGSDIWDGGSSESMITLSASVPMRLLHDGTQWIIL